MSHRKAVALQTRIEALRSRHSALEARIDAEQKRPLPETTRLRSLKARKLILKDELSYYEGVMATLARDMRAPERNVS